MNSKVLPFHRKSYIKIAINMCMFLYRKSTGNPKRTPKYQLAFINS